MKPCAAPGCEKAKCARGRYCPMHASRLHKHGSLDGVGRLVGAPLIDRLMFRVQGGDFRDCWLWQGAVSSSGYGVMNVDGVAVGVHRVAYECFVADIPEGLHLDHLCRTPLCVNPWHLEPVTLGENTRRGLRARQQPFSGGAA